MNVKRSFSLGIAVTSALSVSADGFAYEEDMHFHMTYAILRAVGFPPAEALRVAAVDQGMDDSPGTVANGGLGGVIPNITEEWQWHALDKGGKMKAEWILRRKEMLFYATVTTRDPQAKLFLLGVFFHYEEDTWAHRHHVEGDIHNGIKPAKRDRYAHTYDQFITYNTPFGHAPAMNQPDRSPFDPICAYLCLDDMVKYATKFLTEVLGRSVSPFMADYVCPSNLQEDGSYPRTSAYFHQLAPVGATGSAQKFLAELVRANVDKHGWSADPFYGFHKTADKMSFEAGASVIDQVCQMPEFKATLGSITAPSKADKKGQGFQTLTSAIINAHLRRDAGSGG